MGGEHLSACFNLQQILDLLPIAAFVCDQQGRITCFNDEAVELCGITPKLRDPVSCFHDSFKVLLPNGERVPLERSGMTDATHAGKKVMGRELVIERSDGTRRHVLTHASPLMSNDGAVEGAITLLVDQTRLRCANASLTTSLKLLRDTSKSDKNKSDFLATLAHELRNSLVPLTTGLDLMDMKHVAQNIMEETRAQMKRQVRHMVRLIDDLNDLSAIAMGKLKLIFQAVDIRSACQQAVELTQPLIDRSGHKFSVVLPDQPVYLKADETRITQAISNLLVNAAKFTPEHGTIELRCERLEDGVSVTVRDNGVGIRAEDRDKIFEFFSQTSRDLEGKHGGLGIGLAIARALVQIHGGEIRAASPGPGLGCLFSIVLPIDTAEETPAPEQNGVVDMAVQQRVLLVDDNGAVTSMMKHMLDALGHDVHVASNGTEGISISHQLQPHVIICDIAMPEMSSHDFAERIRGEPWGADVRLIACSGHTGAQQLETGRRAGFDMHLTKPVSLDALVEAMA